MEITNKQFKEVLERAFIHGLLCSPFLEDHLTEKEQEEKVEEVIDDCLRSLKKKIEPKEAKTFDEVESERIKGWVVENWSDNELKTRIETYQKHGEGKSAKVISDELTRREQRKSK